MPKSNLKKYVSPSSRFNPEYEEFDPEYEIVDAEIDWLIIWKAFDNLSYIICTYYEYKLFGDRFPVNFSKQLERCLQLNHDIGFEVSVFDDLSRLISRTEKELRYTYNDIKNWSQYLLHDLSKSSKTSNERSQVITKEAQKQFGKIQKIYDDMCSSKKIGAKLEKLYEKLVEMDGPVVAWNKKPPKEATMDKIREFILLTSVLVLQLSLLKDSDLNQMD